MKDTSGDTFRGDADRKDLGPGQEEMKSTQGVRLGGHAPTTQSRCRRFCTAQHQREGKGVGGAWVGVGGACVGMGGAFCRINTDGKH